MAQTLATDSITPFAKEAYLRELIAAVGTAKRGSRVLVTTMTLDPTEPMILELLEALGNAARRDATVHLAYDAYCYLINPVTKHPGPLYVRGRLPNRNPRGVYATFKQLTRNLEAAGVQVHITNIPDRPRRNPFSGRSHIKTAIVDDRLFVGGCNLSTVRDIDVMVSFVHKQAADRLYGTLLSGITDQSIRHSLHDADKTFQIDNQTQLLLDAGVPKQSLIYDEALKLIDSAQERIFITCQFFPNSTTAARLLTAYRRGVNVTIVYNNPLKHAGMHHKLLQSIVRQRERLRMPPEFFMHQLPKQTPFIHAKVLATESAAMVGSHNYVRVGVQFGTAELALLRRDPAFSKQLVAFIEQQIS